MYLCVSLIVQIDLGRWSLQNVRLAAHCMQANALKAKLALTGNTSLLPDASYFLLGLGMCP